jgi:hypothetical protein
MNPVMNLRDELWDDGLVFCANAIRAIEAGLARRDGMNGGFLNADRSRTGRLKSTARRAVADRQ